METFNNFKSSKGFKCECEELTTVCTQYRELIIIEMENLIML
jgi:hypothetical protein